MLADGKLAGADEISVLDADIASVDMGTLLPDTGTEAFVERSWLYEGESLEVGGTE